MEMTSCPVCGKIHTTGGDAVCKACRSLANIVYEKARAYLRDHPKMKLNAQDLAEAIGEDMRIVQILVMEGRFTGNPDDAHILESEEEKRRKQLLDDLKRNLATPSQQQEQKATTYGSDRHSRSGEGN